MSQRTSGGGPEPTGDAWSRWLLERRHGGAPGGRALALEALRPIRDRLVDNARLSPGDVVLDVGAGDGMIGFAALDRVGESGQVVFSDISEPLVAVCEDAARSLGVHDRCQFLVASATDLSAVVDESVDAVTVRSVLVYVDDKEKAFDEFFRVLRPGGRLSLFEPINSFFYDYAAAQADELTLGATAYQLPGFKDEIAQVKAAAAVGAEQPRSTMLDLDVPRLVGLCDRSGFTSYDIAFDVTVQSASPTSFDVLLDSAPNPLAPTYRELFSELAESARGRLLDALRSAVEQGRGLERLASAYLTATRP